VTGNGKSMDPAGTAWNYAADSDFPRDITILRANATVVFEDGSEANTKSGIYNHHLLFVDQNKVVPSVIACGDTPSYGIRASLFAGGSEDKGDVYYSTPDGMFDAGYYIGPDHEIIMGGDVVNYNLDQKTIYSVTELEFIRGKPEGFLESSVQVFNVAQCDSKSNGVFNIPKEQKKWEMKTRTPMTVSKDGYIVSIRKSVLTMHHDLTTDCL
jgi:hypothetical protein